MTLETVQWVVVLGAGVLTVLILLRILFYVHAQNKKIIDFEKRLHDVEDASHHIAETEEI